LLQQLAELQALPVAERLKQRYAKFRAHGHYLEKAEPLAAKPPRKKAAPKSAAVAA
jgi:hypothetical protein